MLARFPLFVDSSTVNSLGSMAERLSAEAFAAELEILNKPELLRQLSLPRKIRRVVEQAGAENNSPSHVRVMRFDFHYTRDGWRISEVNADVPGGYVEGAGWNELLSHEFCGVKCPPSPTRAYVAAIAERVPPGSLIALAHATVYSEDRQVMVHLGKEMKRQGLNPCLVSPAQIRWTRGQASLETNFARGNPALIVRLLPAEWLPSVCPDEMWGPWFRESETLLSNPGCALALQSKRFPLVWERLATDLKTWRQLLPASRCPSEIDESPEYVLKPALGRVGEDVGIRGVTDEEAYRGILRSAGAHPARWVAQRRFETVPVPTEDGPVYPCIGVFTVNGRMAGLYGRAAFSPLVDENALDVAVLVREQPARSIR